jgi:hypothetical protein
VTPTLWRTVSLYSARSKPYYLLLSKNILILVNCQVTFDQIQGFPMLKKKKGTWRLWSWFPATTNLFEIQMDLQLDAKRVTLVPVESYDQYATPAFWLIAENVDGIEVSLWIGPDWQRICHHQVEHVRLPNRRDQAQMEPEPSGIAAYKDFLLVMVIDRDYRLQLLRFC